MIIPKGTLSISDIQDALYDWVNDATRGVIGDTSIIWRNQSEPLPKRPCVTLKMVQGPSPTDRDPSVFLNSPGERIGYGMQMEATVSVQVFGTTRLRGPKAFQLALDLNSSLMSAETRRKLSVGGVAIQGLGKIQNLTALEESRYEERFGFEIELGLAQTITDSNATIEKVTIQGTASGIPVKSETIILP